LHYTYVNITINYICIVIPIGICVFTGYPKENLRLRIFVAKWQNTIYDLAFLFQLMLRLFRRKMISAKWFRHFSVLIGAKIIVNRKMISVWPKMLSKFRKIVYRRRQTQSIYFKRHSQPSRSSSRPPSKYCRYRNPTTSG